jgi:hypothetical protein
MGWRTGQATNTASSSFPRIPPRCSGLATVARLRFELACLAGPPIHLLPRSYTTTLEPSTAVEPRVEIRGPPGHRLAPLDAQVEHVRVLMRDPEIVGHPGVGGTSVDQLLVPQAVERGVRDHPGIPEPLICNPPQGVVAAGGADSAPRVRALEVRAVLRVVPALDRRPVNGARGDLCRTLGDQSVGVARGAWRRPGTGLGLGPTQPPCHRRPFALGGFSWPLQRHGQGRTPRCSPNAVLQWRPPGTKWTARDSNPVPTARSGSVGCAPPESSATAPRGVTALSHGLDSDRGPKWVGLDSNQLSGRRRAIHPGLRFRPT